MNTLAGNSTYPTKWSVSQYKPTSPEYVAPELKLPVNCKGLVVLSTVITAAPFNQVPVNLSARVSIISGSLQAYAPLGPWIVEQATDGELDGSADGELEGSADGTLDGTADGTADGSADGVAEGEVDGLGVIRSQY